MMMMIMMMFFCFEACFFPSVESIGEESQQVANLRENAVFTMGVASLILHMYLSLFCYMN